MLWWRTRCQADHIWELCQGVLAPTLTVRWWVVGGGSPKAEAARSCHGATIEQCLCSPLCPCCSCNPRGQEINKDKAWHSSRLGELYLGPAMGKSLNHSYVDGPLICCKSGCVRCDGLREWSAGPNDTAPRSTENTRRRCGLICHRKRIHRNGSRVSAYADRLMLDTSL